MKTIRKFVACAFVSLINLSILLSGVSAASPTISSVTANSGPLTGGANVTISGSNFVTGFGAGSGGTITYVGGYTIHTFTSNGTFSVPSSRNVEVLVVAGGGSGAYFTGGGGGAGGLIYESSHSVAAQSYSVTVGNGGSGGSEGVNGENSVFDNLTAIGGGGGGSNSTNGKNGGSGGGAGHNGTTGGLGSSGQGHNGTGGTTGAPNYAAGGGGGAGAVGGSATSTSGGNGGDGLAYSISGSLVYYAGGGGGGTYFGGTYGNGGLGGGGSAPAGNATPNTGGGGGGQIDNGGASGGNGGSGIVIIRYPTGTTVAFDGIPATTVNVVDSETITCTTPAHAAGSVGVTVTNPGGENVTASGIYTYNEPPTVTSVSPQHVVKTGGTNVTVSGAYFSGTPGVTFGGTAGTNVHRVNASTITVDTPAHSTGLVSVVVTNPDGQTGTLNSAITFTESPPTVSSVDPVYGATAGGTNVTITGTNFISNEVVSDAQLMLHGNGTNGSTTITDSTLTPKSVTSGGDASISTAQSKFGGSSIYFDGTGDYLTVPSSSDFAFGTADFTWDVWFNSSSFASGNNYIFDFYGGVVSYNTGKLRYWNPTTGASSALWTQGFGSGLATGTWYHLAAVRESGVTSLYLNGALSTSDSDTYNYTAHTLTIGNDSTYSNGFNGYLDEVRVTKGIARWSSAFSAPTNPYATQCSVTFGGFSATNVEVLSSTSISATTPAHATGAVEIVVTNPDSGSGSKSNGYTYSDTPLGYIVNPLPPTLSAFLGTDWATDVTATGQTGVKSVGIAKGTTRIATLEIEFSANADLGGIVADIAGAKAFFHSTLPISTITNGGATSYTLFIPKGSGDSVWICPGVASFNDISTGCSGGYGLIEGQTLNGATATVSTEADGITYWKVSGLTGTGGMSMLTGVVKDTMSRLAISTAADHEITFATIGGLTVSGQTFTIEFDPSGHNFNLATLAITDIELSDGTAKTLAASDGVSIWGVNINTANDTITFTAPTSGTGYIAGATQLTIKIGTNVGGGVNQIVNPATVGSYQILVTVNNTLGEQSGVAVPIVDSDQVNITGYINTYIYFDIDTTVANLDCTVAVCQLYGDTGAPAGSYIVDLGELNSTYVNESNGASVMHSNGSTGVINSIYLDLTTNAYGGAIVTVSSANQGLQGPGTNLIPSVANNGDPITANLGRYGFTIPNTTSGLGTINRNTNCSIGTAFCKLVSTATEVFNTNSLPLDTGRVRMDLAAAAKSTDNPGSYTDTLTFSAVATY